MPCAHHGHRRASDSTRGSIGLIVEQTAEIGDRPGCHALTQLINRFFERFEIFIECTTRHACGLDHVIDHQMSRSEEHTSELQSLMRISYAVFCLQKKKKN